jgi:hypothetical protein
LVAPKRPLGFFNGGGGGTEGCFAAFSCDTLNGSFDFVAILRSALVVLRCFDMIKL